MFWLRNKKNNFLVRTLHQSPGSLVLHIQNSQNIACSMPSASQNIVYALLHTLNSSPDLLHIANGNSALSLYYDHAQTMKVNFHLCLLYILMLLF